MIVDDHQAAREAIAALLEEHQVAVWQQAERAEEALACVVQEKPDLVLVDLSIDNSLPLISALREQGIPVIVCSSQEGTEYARRALAAGARAYIAKRDVGQALVRTIHDVLNGWVLISPRAADERWHAVFTVVSPIVIHPASAARGVFLCHSISIPCKIAACSLTADTVRACQRNPSRASKLSDTVGVPTVHWVPSPRTTASAICIRVIPHLADP
jgi:CheY-like chemotaxis protein